MNMYTSMFVSVALVLAVVTDAIGINAAIPGLHVMKKPSATSLYFEWHLKDDANQNARLVLECRKKGEAKWRKLPPLGQKRPNSSGAEGVFKGALSGLEAATDYECRFMMTDPDGVEGEAIRVVTAKMRDCTSSSLIQTCEPKTFPFVSPSVELEMAIPLSPKRGNGIQQSVPSTSKALSPETAWPYAWR